MRKITETKLINIVNKPLNEQNKRKFNEDEIDLLHFIFERELKPPFRSDVKADVYGDYWYYNRNNEWIGWLTPKKHFSIIYDPFEINITDKVRQAFGFSRNTPNCWYVTKPHLKSWLEAQINTKIRKIGI